jgi:hypothetical protein
LLRPYGAVSLFVTITHGWRRGLQIFRRSAAWLPPDPYPRPAAANQTRTSKGGNPQELAVFRPIPSKLVGTDAAFRLTAGSFRGTGQSFQGAYGGCRPTDSPCQGTRPSCPGARSSCPGTGRACQGTGSGCQGTRSSCQATAGVCRGAGSGCQGTDHLCRCRRHAFPGIFMPEATLAVASSLATLRIDSRPRAALRLSSIAAPVTLLLR